MYFRFPHFFILNSCLVICTLMLSSCHRVAPQKDRAQLLTQLDEWEVALDLALIQLDSCQAQYSREHVRIVPDSLPENLPYPPLLADSLTRKEFNTIAGEYAEEYFQACILGSELTLQLRDLRIWVQGLVHNRTSNQRTQHIWENRKVEIEEDFAQLESLTQNAEGQIWLLQQFTKRVLPDNSTGVNPVP